MPTIVNLTFSIQGKPAVDKRRQQGAALDAASSLPPQAVAPMVVTTPKYLTVDGLAVPLRPIPPVNISYTHTDSTYSRMSQRSDCSRRLEEGDENAAGRDPSQQPATGESPESQITAVNDAPPTCPAPATPLPVAPAKKPLHVLVIDDDPLTRLLMTRVWARTCVNRSHENLLMLCFATDYTPFGEGPLRSDISGRKWSGWP